MVSQASRLRDVRYDIRGPVLRRARQLEAEGHEILKLNLGNPAPFGLNAPESVLRDVVHSIRDAQGYSDARGIYPARLAVAESFERADDLRRHARPAPRPHGNHAVRGDRPAARPLTSWPAGAVAPGTGASMMWARPTCHPRVSSPYVYRRNPNETVRHWTEPHYSCWRISPTQNASPPELAKYRTHGIVNERSST